MLAHLFEQVVVKVGIFNENNNIGVFSGITQCVIAVQVDTSHRAKRVEH